MPRATRRQSRSQIVGVAQPQPISGSRLNLDAESVQVTGKGSRVRVAYFGGKTGLALDRYLRARRGHRHAADPALFLGRMPYAS